VEGHSDHFDWNNLARHYVAAHRMALQKHHSGAELVPADRGADEEPRETPRPQPKRTRRRRATTGESTSSK